MAKVMFAKGMNLDAIPAVTITRSINQAHLVAGLAQLRQDYKELAELQGTDLDRLQLPAAQVLEDLANIIMVSDVSSRGQA